MEKKRIFLFLVFIILFVSIFLTSLVSAKSFFGGVNLRRGAEQVIGVVVNFAEPFLQVLLNTTSGEYFFAKVLLLLLLFIVIFTIIKNIPTLGDNRTVTFLIAAIVSVLAVRYIPDNTFFRAILTPYSAMGIALIVFLPFLIYFFFVHSSVPGTFGRRAAWFVFGIVFIVLWALRGSDLGEANWIYLLGIVFVGLSFIFDHSIHRYFGLYELGRTEQRISDAQRVNLLDQLRTATRVYNETGDRVARRRMRELARQLGTTVDENIRG